jgi:hypothetical protein
VVVQGTVQFSFDRGSSGSQLTIASTDLNVEIRFDGEVLTELDQQRLWPRAVKVVQGAVELWRGEGSLTFVATAPRRFMSWLAGRARTKTDKWETWHRQIGESELDNDAPFEALARCVELGLHQWRTKRDATSCAICSAAWERVRNDSRLGPTLLGIIGAAPLKGRERRTYESFEKLKRETRDDRLRIILHSEGLARATDDELTALKYIAVLGNKDQVARLLRTRANEVTAGGIAPVEVFERVDAEGNAMIDMKVPEPAPIVNVELCERWVFDRLRKSYGDDGAQAAAVGVSWAHLTVTLDPGLLNSADERLLSDAAIVTPLEAARLLALRARLLASMPPAPEGMLSLRPQHYYDARPYVQIPHLRVAYEWIRALDNEEKKQRCLDLYWSTHERLSLLARAEDEIGFRHFFKFQRPIEDELLYHFEFQVLTAQSLLEGLRTMWATLTGLPPRTGWDGLIRQGGPVSQFIAGEGESVIQLIGVLRNPMAHEIRWETSHGIETRFVHLENRHAESVARCLKEMHEPPLCWGIRDHPVNLKNVELLFQPYAFAVSLTARLYWFTGRYLTDLVSGRNDVDLAAPAPWNMTNPPLDKPSHGLINLLAWPLPMSPGNQE